MGARRLRSVPVLVAAVVLSGPSAWPAYAAPLSTSQPMTSLASSGNPGSWTVYHGNLAGLGTATDVSSVNTTKRAWTSPALDGSGSSSVAGAGTAGRAWANDAAGGTQGSGSRCVDGDAESCRPVRGGAEHGPEFGMSSGEGSEAVVAPDVVYQHDSAW